MKMTVLLFSLTTLFVITACGVFSGLGFKTITGSGDVVTEIRDVSGFDSVDVCCGMVLILTQGESESLEIEADDNFMEEILTTVENAVLNVHYRTISNVNYRPSKPVRLYLSAVDVSKISISGGGELKNESLNSDRFELDISGGGSAQMGTLAVDDVSLHVSGGGEIDADTIQAEMIRIHMSGGGITDIKALKADTLTLESSGGGRTEIAGSITGGNIDLSGGSNFDGKELDSKEMVFSSSGGGHSTIWVEESLEVTLSGGASVGYYGSPGIIREELSGGSSLDSLGKP
ncbi:MAG: GIN domain-containing protein [Candidatus Hermodarchaeia archaeon]|jgi:hypothetical protein